MVACSLSKQNTKPLKSYEMNHGTPFLFLTTDWLTCADTKIDNLSSESRLFSFYQSTFFEWSGIQDKRLLKMYKPGWISLSFKPTCLRPSLINRMMIFRSKRSPWINTVLVFPFLCDLCFRSFATTYLNINLVSAIGRNRKLKYKDFNDCCLSIRAGICRLHAKKMWVAASAIEI